MKAGDSISSVVFKLRVVGPRTRDAPKRNKAHMEYIGRRRGVVLNEGMKHGLFGVADGKKAEDVKNIHDLSRYIEEKTKSGAIAYRAVISLAEADAVRLGYDNPDKWRELVQARIPDMCAKVGIPIQNLEYTAAIHRDKGHPHCHILFWDKAQDVKKKAYVHPKVSNAIRTGLIKYVFDEEMAELQEMKNEARRATLDNAGGFFGGFVDAFADMTASEYAAAVERLKREGDLADGKLIYNRFKTADMKELATALFDLAEKIPKTGRLNLKLMPPEVKDGIIEFLEKLLEKNADCDREFKKYVRAAMKLAAYYSDDPESHNKAGKSAYDDMMIRLGNSVLRSLKKLNRQTRSKEWEVKHEAFRRQMMESLITEIFSILSRAANAEVNNLNHAYRTGELSKQAKKELAMKMGDSSGYDWG
jgi:hypothetical protein